MTGNPRLPSELGDVLRRRREELKLSKKAVAESAAGRVREVIYRLEGGEEATVSSRSTCCAH